MPDLPNLTPDSRPRSPTSRWRNVVREFPDKPDHVLGAAHDARRPRDLHPAFYGSFDWHSCVHMHWLLARVRRLFPALPERAAIDACSTAISTRAQHRRASAPISRARNRASFERTYGWAWLLELARELARGDDAAIATLVARRSRRSPTRSSRAISTTCRASSYPLRHGVHANSAFGLLFALDYARAAARRALAARASSAALRWFGDDRDAPAAWEPSGADFLSPALVEADLMRRVLPRAATSRLARRIPAAVSRRASRPRCSRRRRRRSQRSA